MILLTRLNGPVFALNPDLLERADCTPDTVLTLVDGTKYLVAESLPDVIALVRQYRASVVADAQQLSGHPAGTGRGGPRGGESLTRGGESAERGGERPGGRAAELTLERAGQRAVERRGQRTVERRGQRPAEGGSAPATPAQATAASKVAPGPTATSTTNVVQLPRRER